MPQTPFNSDQTPSAEATLTSGPLLCPVCRACGKVLFQGTDLMFGGTRSYQYMRCGSCGADYQAPMPSLEEIAGFYPPGYSVHQPPAKERRPGWLRQAVLRCRYGYEHLSLPALLKPLAPLFARIRVKGAIPFVPGGKLLDIGCGNGKFLLIMNGLGWLGMGLELSEAAVAVCRQAGLNVVGGELSGAGFEDEVFDLVTVRHLIEHLSAPRDFIRQVARILKPGGRLVIETPNSRALARSWFGPYWYANDVPRHLVLFHPGNLRRLVEDQGLTLVLNQLTTSPKIFLNSWDYFCGNRGRPSKKRKVRRLLVRPYMMLAQLTGRGDTIFQMYEKR